MKYKIAWEGEKKRGEKRERGGITEKESKREREKQNEG